MRLKIPISNRDVPIPQEILDDANGVRPRAASSSRSPSNTAQRYRLAGSAGRLVALEFQHVHSHI
jgi:hypothetical protein